MRGKWGVPLPKLKRKVKLNSWARPPGKWALALTIGECTIKTEYLLATRSFSVPFALRVTSSTFFRSICDHIPCQYKPAKDKPLTSSNDCDVLFNTSFGIWLRTCEFPT